jgi:ABC-type dipeptide/oligopeptide/nickel transport system permease component
MYVVILRRLGQGLIVGFLVALLVFTIARVLPGDPARIMSPHASEETLVQIREEMGLNRPVPVQFVAWTAGAIRGNFGDSIYLRQPVTDVLGEPVRNTMLLVALAVLLAILISLPVGTLAAVHRDTWFDRLALGFSVLAQSLPNFWLALMLLFVVTVRWGLVPAVGFKGPAYLILPVVALSFSMYAVFIRNVRLVMLGALESNYFMAAQARGIPFWNAVAYHAFKNSWIPLLTILGVQIGYLLGGSIVVEYIFNYPGMGLLLIRSVLRRDYPVIQAVALIMSMAFVLINMLVDISYGYIDPRIRKQAQT